MRVLWSRAPAAATPRRSHRPATPSPWAPTDSAHSHKSRGWLASATPTRVVERAAFAPEWFCLNPEGAGLQVNEMYRRNAERFARGRSGQSHTATATDLDSDASDADREAARLRAEAEQADASKRERRIVVTLNKLGAAATGVRRQFVTTLLARLVDCTSWVSIGVGPAV